MWAWHSSANKKREPICTPSAPINNAAAIPRPSTIAPATTTGMEISGKIFSIKDMVVWLPICPPASIPSIIIASAPASSIRLASFRDGTTGITLMPASCNGLIYGTGLPAPSVTNAGFSSMIISTNSSLLGAINMRLTPKGLSVKSLQARISLRVHSASRPPRAITPVAPALATAATSLCSDTQAIAPWMIGYSICKSCVNAVLIKPPMITIRFTETLLYLYRRILYKNDFIFLYKIRVLIKSRIFISIYLYTKEIKRNIIWRLYVVT